MFGWLKRNTYLQYTLQDLERRVQNVELDIRRANKPEPPKWPQSSAAKDDREFDPPLGMAAKGDHKAKIIDVQSVINHRGDGINIKIRMELPYDRTGEITNSVWAFIHVKHPAMAVTPLMYLLNLMMQQEKDVPIKVRYKSYEGRIYPQVDIRWDLLLGEIDVEVPEVWS